MKAVVKTDEAMTWEGEEGPYHRRFRLMFERDITPTINIAAGMSIISPGKEQPKLSVHEAEEIYLVLRGRGKFCLGDRVFDIDKGTAVYVAPGVAHRAVNTGDEDLELYWVNTPPVFGRVGGYVDFVPGWKRTR